MIEWMGIQEADVTLTDYLLFVECAAISVAVYKKKPSSKLGHYFCAFFFSLSLASLFGGSVHGFCSAGSFMHDLLWLATLFALGGTTLSLWLLGGAIGLSTIKQRWLRAFASCQFIGYVLVALFVTQKFSLVIVNYFPAILFFLTMLILCFWRSREKKLLYGIGGVLLTLFASALQMMKVAIHPLYFDHNALYHIIAFVAFLLIMKSACYLIQVDNK